MGVNSNRATTCKHCGEQIVYFKVQGKYKAVDAHRVEAGDSEFDPRRHVAHFCSRQSYETARRPIGR